MERQLLHSLDSYIIAFFMCSMLTDWLEEIYQINIDLKNI